MRVLPLPALRASLVAHAPLLQRSFRLTAPALVVTTPQSDFTLFFIQVLPEKPTNVAARAHHGGGRELVRLRGGGDLQPVRGGISLRPQEERRWSGGSGGSSIVGLVAIIIIEQQQQQQQ